jgi:zinc resistance-associated protein
MNRTVMSVAALALVGAGVFAFAQTQTRAPSEPEMASPEPSFPAMAGMRSSAEDRAVLLDARIVAVKAVLRLTPDQEKLWEPVEAFIRKGAAQRAQRAKETRELIAEPPSGSAPGFDPIAKMRKQADRMAERAAFLRDFADAAAPLFASLSGDQKRRALLLFNRSRANMMGGARRGGGGGGMMGSEIDWPG